MKIEKLNPIKVLNNKPIEEWEFICRDLSDKINELVTFCNHLQPEVKVDFLQVGDAIECGNCFPWKYPSCKAIEEKFGIKCTCKCHHPKVEEKLAETYFPTLKEDLSKLTIDTEVKDK